MEAPGELRTARKHNLRCEYASATYQVHLGYVNGSRSFTYDLIPGEKLATTFTKDSYPDFLAKGSWRWNSTTIRNLRNINLYGLLDSVVMTSAGSYDQMICNGGHHGTFPYTLSNGTTLDVDVADVPFTYVGMYMGE